MRSETRTRLSLIWRMLVALAVLAAVSVPILLTAVVVSGVLVWVAVLCAVAVLEVTVLPLLFDQQFGVLDVAVASGRPIVVVAGILLLPVLYVRPVRDEIREFRTELRSGTPASDRHPEVATIARRLAQQADVPEPDVYIANRRRPESYALGGRADGTIVITRGVVRRLSDDELQAVLAHEISHLANGDSRIMNLAVVPMLVAERVGSDERPTLGDWLKRGISLPLAYLAHLVLWSLLTVVTTVQSACSRAGVAFLSRGREFAADRGAARLTGAPGDLASALRTLDDERGPPDEDKRTWMRSASALDILPRDDQGTLGRVFQTHPSTEERIDRLETLVVETERGGR